MVFVALALPLLQKNMWRLTSQWYLAFRPILFQICGNTEKQGRFSWMDHKAQLPSSSGPSQMRRPWLSSSVTPNELSTFFFIEIFYCASFSVCVYIYVCVCIYRMNETIHMKIESHLCLILGRRGSVIEWWSSVRCGKINGRRGKRKRQRVVGSRLALRTSLGLPESECRWAQKTVMQI